MAGLGAQSATARLHTAFGKALPQRCIDICKIIDETSVKELHSVLPLLLESVFGFKNQPGWGLNRLNKNHYHEFNTLRNFLGPRGPVLTLVHKLLLDPYCRYEFPLSCLPYPSRHTLEEGGTSAFYASKLQFHPGHGRPYNMLSLTSFEFYFFHFSYLLVNPTAQKMTGWSSPSDALYPILLEDYLHYYFPLEGRRVAPISHMAQPVRSPISHQSPGQRPQAATSPTSGGPSRLNISGLLRSSFYQTTQTNNQQTTPQPADPVEQETWRSQTLLEILVEFWLNQNTLENNKSAFSQVTPHMAGWGQHHPNITKIDPYYYIMVESFLPSSDHVRMVRMFIKHLHFFVNAAKVEIISSPYSTPVISQMDDFRRQVFPQFVQKKIYAFLRHGFERWPLDSSFRLMLETWLSFIQPWRYTDASQQYHRDRGEQDRTVDEKWFPFIRENLLFFTVLFQEFLPRVFRMDLCASKNAYMLFRVSKVFNLPNLGDMIRDAESALYEPVQRLAMPRVHSAQVTDLGGSYLSPAHSNRASPLSLQFTELEAPGFIYKPFFSEFTEKQIEQLLMTVSLAKQNAKSMQAPADNGNGSFLSWLGLGSGVDYQCESYANHDLYDDLGGGDSRKLEYHLETSTTNLCNIFQLPVPHDVDVTSTNGQAANLYPEGLAPDYIETENGPQLTPLGRYQMMNGLRRFDVQARGDPDVQRIRTFECTFLVRLLYHVSAFLNERYEREIEDLYHRDDFFGRLAAQYLTVPIQARSQVKARKGTIPSPMSKEVRAVMSRPRISLRWLASYQNLGYIGAFYLLAYLWLGMGSIGGLMLIILVGLLYGVFMAVFCSKVHVKND